MRGFMGPPKYPKVANYSDPQFLECIMKSIVKYDYQKCNCSPICEEEAYEVKVNRNPWPQSWQASSVSHIVSAMKGVESVSPDEVRERLMRLSVYYDEMVESTFEEKEMYDLSAFTSDLGGQMDFPKVFWLMFKFYILTGDGLCNNWWCGITDEKRTFPHATITVLPKVLAARTSE
eukprot:gene2060-17627_t